uniref:Membrane protein BRI3 n=1 Tax=Micrurus lemniscatus lemniscatus TaxID=129467 RepID=A0A2D4I6I9_MICLE
MILSPCFRCHSNFERSLNGSVVSQGLPVNVHHSWVSFVFGLTTVCSNFLPSCCVISFCRVGVLEDTFTCLGILCAIVFFPVGIIFCLALRQRTCPNCGATFG